MKMLNIPYNNYKTQMCKYFVQEGVCKFGNNCSYSHGQNELRNPYDNLPISIVSSNHATAATISQMQTIGM